MIAQMTMRQVPDAVEKKLRARAQKTGRSINRTAIELLEEALGIKPSDGKKRNLSMLAGRWNETDYKEFQSHTAKFDRIDEDIWAS